MEHQPSGKRGREEHAEHKTKKHKKHKEKKKKKSKKKKSRKDNDSEDRERDRKERNRDRKDRDRDRKDKVGHVDGTQPCRRGRGHNQSWDRSWDRGRGGGRSDKFSKRTAAELEKPDDATFKKIARAIRTKYMEGPQLNIPSEFVHKICDKLGVSALFHAISYLIDRDELEFPYKRYFIKDVQNKFDNLTKYRGKVEYGARFDVPGLQTSTNFLYPFTFRGEYTLLTSEKSEYNNIQIISDAFIEHARVRSAIKDKPTTMAYWRDPAYHAQWLPKVLEKRVCVNTYELREGLYNACKAECSTFKMTVASTVIRMFNATRVLDFCSGWGDRLFGAVSCQDQLELYCGVDPNSLLFPGYKNIIDSFAKDKDRFVMLNYPFETCVMPEHCQRFDLIFTGPPYFDYELYGDGKGQSTSSFSRLEDWVVKFLFFSIYKAWGMLEEGGHMAINIGEAMRMRRDGVSYVEVFILWVQATLPNALYEGVMAFAGANAKLARPIWVFHKVKDEGQGEGLGGEKQSEAVKQGAGNDESGDNAADWVRCRNKRLEAQTLMDRYYRKYQILWEEHLALKAAEDKQSKEEAEVKAAAPDDVSSSSSSSNLH